MTDTSEPTAPPRRRTTWVAAAALVAVALLAVGFLANRHDTTSPHRAPTFTVTDVRHPSRTVTLTSRRGTPVVLNFWATWCVPCRKEMPDLEAVHRSLGGRIAFIGIDNRDSRRLAIKFLRDTGVTYPTGFDPDGQIAAAYGVLGMPTTVFISADGTVVAKHTGQLRASTLRDDVARYFDLRPG
jgi:cytochrome c biogenesis protein CcmG/thiol:disulfide interchange protein DsbE